MLFDRTMLSKTPARASESAARDSCSRASSGQDEPTRMAPMPVPRHSMGWAERTLARDESAAAAPTISNCNSRRASMHRIDSDFSYPTTLSLFRFPNRLSVTNRQKSARRET